MKTLKIVLGLVLAFSINGICAQETNQVTQETSEKTYKIMSNDKVIKNSVKVSTEVSQEVALSEEDKNKIDQTRVIPPKKITKTVLIDNDEDDAYDEKIVFSYVASSKTDFTLVTNEDEVVVGIDDGENLKILQSESINKNELKNKTEAYVFTDNDGQRVEFYIESYESLTE